MSGREFVTVVVAGQLFGIPVGEVRDVLRKQTLTPVPLAPPALAGLLNLRGRIVTAIDLRARLGVAAGAAGAAPIIVVVEHAGELSALVVDRAGEVVEIGAPMEPVPASLDPAWAAIAGGLLRGERGLVVALNLSRALDLSLTTPARSKAEAA